MPEDEVVPTFEDVALVENVPVPVDEVVDAADVVVVPEPVVTRLDELAVDPVVGLPLEVELLVEAVEQAKLLRASPNQRANFTIPPSKGPSYPSLTNVAR
jgi:hypothetical protein